MLNEGLTTCHWVVKRVRIHHLVLSWTLTIVPRWEACKLGGQATALYYGSEQQSGT